MVLRPGFLPVSMLDFPMAIVFQASIGDCGMKVHEGSFVEEVRGQPDRLVLFLCDLGPGD